ncbi:MAG TPA: DUF308 domain-containing protein [Gemmatimonadaceae bacterium]|nr:DUF308 domain-containing protein [Gemmatimonadaceae bacterium]
MITDDIKAAYSQTKWALALRGLLGIALGIFILARPLASVAALAIVIAVWALIDGITNIVRAFAVRGLMQHWWLLLLTGAVSVAFGIAAFYYYPALSLTYAVIWTAFWLFTGGAMAISVGVAERRADVPWAWTMALGVVSIIGGFLAFMYPGLTLASLISLIASFGIVSGAVMLISLAKLRSFEKDVTGAAHVGGRRQSA